MSAENQVLSAENRMPRTDLRAGSGSEEARPSGISNLPPSPFCPGPRHSALSTQHSVLSPRYSALSPRHSALSTQFSALPSQRSGHLMSLPERDDAVWITGVGLATPLG